MHPRPEMPLSGVNLLWATQPSNNYTAAELNVMSNFLAGGGRIAFMGEHGGNGFSVEENNRINAAISALGGSDVGCAFMRTWFLKFLSACA